MTPPFIEAWDFANVPVMPFTQLFNWADDADRYHTGGPLWPDWEHQTGARFQLVMDEGYGPVDEAPPLLEPETVHEGDHFFWIGPLYNHFGHQIRDLSARILPSLIADPEAVLVFGRFGHEGDSLDSVPPFIADILRWYSVPPERVLLVNRPALFRRLRVMTQPEMGRIQDDSEPPNPAYVEALTTHAQSRLPVVERAGVVFVSRSRARPLLSGEALLDAWFAASGHQVVYPEELNVQAQLELYASAETIVFTEGSAVHGAQLLGRNLGHVVVLVRRPGRRLGRAFLLPRSERVTHIEALTGLVSAASESQQVHGFAVVDPVRLRADLEAAGIAMPVALDPLAFAEAQEHDLTRWCGRWGEPMARGGGEVARAQMRRSLLEADPPGLASALRWLDALDA